MRVAYYWGQYRLPKSDANNNPYGPLLAEGLERLGVEFDFVVDLDEAFIRANQGKYDVLHLNWPHYFYYDDDHAVMERQLGEFIALLELAIELGYKIVWTAHNLYPHNQRHKDLDHIGRLAMCRLARSIISHCRYAEQAVRDTFGRTERMFLTPHGNFIDVYPDLLTRETARAQLGIPESDFVYGSFGSIQPYKGIEALIESYAKLSGDNAWLVISGGGKADYHAQIHEMVREMPRVILRTYPRAPSEDIALVMRSADVVTLPFVATMTSGTLILALSWGKPVIAPALGCLPETVLPEAGILYDASAPDGLFRAMDEIRTWDQEKAGAAALASVRRFDWDEIAATTLEAYNA
jgi:glycosyltransferase involved in cell wall biosynthesis